MNDKELKLTAEMLEEYAERLGNDCCNDYCFPDDWTKAERVQFVKEFHDWNGDPEEFDGSDYISNHCVVSLLAYKIDNTPPTS